MMRMLIYRSVLPCLFIFLFSFMVKAQLPTATNPVALNDSGNLVNIIKSDLFRRVKQEQGIELNQLVGNVVLKQKNTLFYCDSAIQDFNTNQFVAFGNIHINDEDSVHTYAQYLKYDGNTKMAELKKKVKMTDGKGVLTTESLQYDVAQKIGTYLNNGKVVNGKSVLTSKEGIYYASSRDVFFRKNVKLNDPEYKLSTDTLLYNVDTEITKFLSPTRIYDGKSSIDTRSGFYDLKKGIAFFDKRPVLIDSTQEVTANEIHYEKESGKGHAEGNVVYLDTSQGMSMLAGKADFSSNSKQVKAFENPLMAIRQEKDKDSIFIAADTLFSAYVDMDSSSIKSNKDTSRYFVAYNHVKIFSDSLQGKCDSLYYSGLDSVFRFFREPVMWAQGSQISGDTILLFTRNRKPHLVLVNENAFSVSRTPEGFFNQLKGNRLIGNFVDGEIDLFKVNGNSESLYYLQDDDSAYIGMTYSMADAINMKFVNRSPKRVTWINGVTGKTYPFLQIPEDKKELRDFKWLEALRPKSAEELKKYTKTK